MIISIVFALVVYLTPIAILSVNGHSMEPKIGEGDAIVIFPVNTNEIRTGDIITYLHEDISITHQVIGFEDGKIQTKGINLPHKDPYLVERSEVIGKHLVTIPYGSFVAVFVRSPAGFLTLIFLPSALIIVNEGRKIKQASIDVRRSKN